MLGMEAILGEILKRRPARPPFVIGIAGSVAVGKSTFARALAGRIATLPEEPKVEIVSTDGFLFPNAILAERGLRRRKGYPESFDVEALRRAVGAIRRGERVEVPLYSHVTYDIDREKTQIVSGAEIVILDGLHLARIEEAGAPRLIDCLLYLDAEEASIERWFTDRLLPLMVAGVDDPKSFYYAYRELDLPKRLEFAQHVWANINLPNLRDHIADDRAAADLVLKKAPDHRVVSIAAGAGGPRC
jgi:type I pantothenate kinase